MRGPGLVYRGTGDGGHGVYCPVCLKYRAGDVHTIINLVARLSGARKIIARHMAIQRHKEASEEHHLEATRALRRRQVGLSNVRTALQTLREGASYVQMK